MLGIEPTVCSQFLFIAQKKCRRMSHFGELDRISYIEAKKFQATTVVALETQE